ncbi:MAG: nucleotidyltransferase domain-containing protein [Lachnospiraceae bacterium]|nr:nucleotidyltransferase domain-containing protein [Lachnospiraceae bacterium]
MPINEIEELKNQFVKQLSPIRIYLFGSFANGTNSENSDFDFYIVVDDKVTDLVEMTASAYKAIQTTKQRPVDIIVGTSSRFNERKNMMSVENEVFEKGVLLYESGNETVA